MRPGLAYDHFTARGRRSWLMRIGEAAAPPILFVPPLFEEMNRLRALMAAVMRRLAAAGLGCWLPDLAGTGESEIPLQDVTWDDWRHDVAAAFDHLSGLGHETVSVAAFRGGCLLDDAAAGASHWRLSPVPGRSLARDMERAGLSGAAWGGYAPSNALRAALEAAVPSALPTCRTVRLASDRQEADARLAGPALWRRSEPSGSAELAEGIAADLLQWRATCAAC